MRNNRRISVERNIYIRISKDGHLVQSQPSAGIAIAIVCLTFVVTQLIGSNSGAIIGRRGHADMRVLGALPYSPPHTRIEKLEDRSVGVLPCTAIGMGGSSVPHPVSLALRLTFPPSLGSSFLMYSPRDEKKLPFSSASMQQSEPIASQNTGIPNSEAHDKKWTLVPTRVCGIPPSLHASRFSPSYHAFRP